MSKTTNNMKMIARLLALLLACLTIAGLVVACDQGTNTPAGGGTGGTEYVVVTAVIKTDGGESLRKFKIKVTG